MPVYRDEAVRRSTWTVNGAVAPAGLRGVKQEKLRFIPLP